MSVKNASKPTPWVIRKLSAFSTARRCGGWCMCRAVWSTSYWRGNGMRQILSFHRFFPAMFMLAGVMFVAFGGCGYQFVGESSLLPKDARTIYVEPFVNRSRDVGMDKELTTALRGEFYRRGQLRVVERSEQA